MLISQDLIFHHFLNWQRIHLLLFPAVFMTERHKQITADITVISIFSELFFFFLIIDVTELHRNEGKFSKPYIYDWLNVFL